MLWRPCGSRMKQEKSEFQKRFAVDDEFYTREQIIQAIFECFPDDGRYRDARGFKRLRRIMNGSIAGPRRPESEEELHAAIPHFLEFNGRKYEAKFRIDEVDSESKCAEYSTSFIATDCGYICTEQTWEDFSSK